MSNHQYAVIPPMNCRRDNAGKGVENKRHHRNAETYTIIEGVHGDISPSVRVAHRKSDTHYDALPPKGGIGLLGRRGAVVKLCPGRVNLGGCCWVAGGLAGRLDGVPYLAMLLWLGRPESC